MLRKQPGWTPSRISTLAALILAAGYWFLPAAQVALAAWMTISPDFSTLPGGIVGQVWSRTFTATGGVEPYTWSSIGINSRVDLRCGHGHSVRNAYDGGIFFLYVFPSKTRMVLTLEILARRTFLVRANTTTTLSLVSDGPGGQIMVGFPVWATVTVSETALGTPEADRAGGRERGQR